MVTSSYPRWEGDGAGSFVASLAEALANRGHEISVVAPYDAACTDQDASSVQVHRFRYAPAKHLHIAGHGRALEADRQLRALAHLLMPGFGLAALGKVRQIVRQQGVDVLHGHWAVPGGAVAGISARCRKLPFVISLHGSGIFVIEHNALYAQAARFGFSQAQHVAACSKDLRSRAIAIGLDASRSSVIPYGVDTERFSQGDGQAFRAKLGIRQDGPVIGALGRLVYKKGFGHLIQAMNQVVAQYPQAQCVIGGEGDLHHKLGEKIDQSGLGSRVRLLGHVDWTETPAFYAMCDIMAVPSVIDAQGNVDGLPNVLLESMASGTAVVASHVAGIPEAIIHNDNGILCPPGDESALAQALCRLLGNASHRATLGEHAQQTMVSDYSWDRIASTYEERYAAAIDEVQYGR